VKERVNHECQFAMPRMKRWGKRGARNTADHV
jgi:hypothetical protein